MNTYDFKNRVAIVTEGAQGIGRMLEVEEAASMICWLATEGNSFTTAAVFDLPTAVPRTEEADR